MQLEFLITWMALACCVVLIGRMLDNETIMGVGVVMVGFTCAFKC